MVDAPERTGDAVGLNWFLSRGLLITTAATTTLKALIALFLQAEVELGAEASYVPLTRCSR